jgi:ATP-dependent exoDNAse (exonuclease V) alpha subunit
MAEIDFKNEGFEYAEKLVLDTRYSVFLTGKAGTGKSTFLRYIADKTTKNFIVVAPTGIAAINARGETIHSFFGIPFGPLQPSDPRLKNNRYNEEKTQVMENLELLIIDEISMVRADLLDGVDYILRKVRRNPYPFGGVQVLLVGDLFQLEPVVTQDEKPFLQNYYRSPYFFNAWALRELDLVNIELEKIYRQEDPFFIGILNGIRNNTATYDDLVNLNRRPSKVMSDDNKFYITLSTTRKTADKTNAEKLSALPGELFEFEGKVEDDFPDKNLPTDRMLQLKEGAQVIFIKNDIAFNRKWVNGTIGVVEKIEEDQLTVKLDSGKQVVVERSIWENVKFRFNAEKNRIEEEVIGKFTQFPVKLAWAVTIHKSQGLTFDNVILDMGTGAFAAGQLYVALSRCRTLEGIILKNKIRQRDIIVREEVLAYYEKMNDFSQINNLLGLP